MIDFTPPPPGERTVLEHPAFGTRTEALSLPMVSPRLLDAVAYRDIVVDGPFSEQGQVTLMWGFRAYVTARDAERIAARREAREIVRRGLQPVQDEIDEIIVHGRVLPDDVALWVPA